jgi:hypothetical protein
VAGSTSGLHGFDLVIDPFLHALFISTRLQFLIITCCTEADDNVIPSAAIHSSEPGAKCRVVSILHTCCITICPVLVLVLLLKHVSQNLLLASAAIVLWLPAVMLWSVSLQTSS